MSLKPIIIDLGSCEVKSGYRTEEGVPSIRFPSYIGEPKYNKILRTLNKSKSEFKEQFVGDSCEPYLGILKLRYPIKHGVFSNEEDISLIFNHIYSNLKLSSEKVSQHPLLISEPILNPKSNRENIAEILFEKYNIPSLIFGYQPSLSLLAFSSTSGVIVETGDGVSQTCSVIDGYSIPSSFIRSDFGGEDVSDYFRKLLRMKGFDLITETEKLLLHEIKRKYLNCNLDGKKEDKVFKYVLPDQKVIQLDSDNYYASKVLFNPSLVGKNCLGLHHMLSTCIEKTNSEFREKLCSNIKLTGGNSCIKGLSEVLHTQIKLLLPKFKNNAKIKTMNSNSAAISCWMGGTIIANLGIFKDLLITKENWEDSGKNILHKQTF